MRNILRLAAIIAALCVIAFLISKILPGLAFVLISIAVFFTVILGLDVAGGGSRINHPK